MSCNRGRIRLLLTMVPFTLDISRAAVTPSIFGMRATQEEVRIDQIQVPSQDRVIQVVLDAIETVLGAPMVFDARIIPMIRTALPAGVVLESSADTFVQEFFLPLMRDVFVTTLPTISVDAFIQQVLTTIGRNAEVTCALVRQVIAAIVRLGTPMAFGIRMDSPMLEQEPTVTTAEVYIQDAADRLVAVILAGRTVPAKLYAKNTSGSLFPVTLDHITTRVNEPLILGTLSTFCVKRITDRIAMLELYVRDASDRLVVVLLGRAPILVCYPRSLIPAEVPQSLEVEVTEEHTTGYRCFNEVSPKSITLACTFLVGAGLFGGILSLSTPDQFTDHPTTLSLIAGIAASGMTCLGSIACYILYRGDFR